MSFKKGIDVKYYKERMHAAQEKANMLFKQSKVEDPIKASYYSGIWEALVWVQFDIENNLFEEIEN